jgi:drug/metabolite transporter (DMT)-like permease
VSLRKYLILAGVMIFGPVGDSLLSVGMKDGGRVSIHDLTSVLFAIQNPWILGGVVLLLAFFAAYTTALSWADLTYVLPATSLGYVLLALIARFFLHEQVSLTRWLGILLISSGVGFVTRGPALTKPRRKEILQPAEEPSPEPEPVGARSGI